MGSVRRDFSPPSRSARRLAGAVLGAFALVVLAAAGCTDPPRNIVVGNASRADVTEVVDASASVTAKAVAVLAAPADGTVAALSVQPGQAVAAGQPLAVIDSPAARDRLAQAGRALDALSGGGPGPSSSVELVAAQRRTDHDAAAAFAQARDHAAAVTDPKLKAALLAQVEAGERAYRDAAASAQALINSVQRGLAGVGQAMGALTAAQRVQAQAAYDVAKSTVDALALTAPIAGVVQLGGVPSGPAAPSLGDLIGAAAGPGAGGAGAGAATGSGAAQRSGPGVDSAVLPGARVSAGTPVVTVVDTSELGLVAEVDETDVLLVTPGVTASIELDAAPGARYDAAVRSVDLLPGASARGGVSYRVRLSVGGGKYSDGRAAPTPRPGMSAVAHLAVRAARAALAVPAAAVFSAGGRDSVWVVRGGKAVRAPVTVGVSGQDLVQVVAGVADGDRIVVRGADQVRVGQQLP
jgi:multidrug efflux pump subunit AcrA (membrane-fusion protein)